MTDQEGVYEDDFAVVDKKDYDKQKKKTQGKNIYEDLINLNIISPEDYNNASDEQKKAYDELKAITKNLD